MRNKSCVSLCLLGWIFTVSVLASERGVVVEEIRTGSVLEKAGVLPGDVFLSWERLPNPPANPRGARGEFVSPFEWIRLEIEEAPRGVVRLTGRRESEYVSFEIPQGRWRAAVRPASQESTRWLHWQTGESRRRARSYEAAAQSYREALDPSAPPWLRAWIWECLGRTYEEQGEFKRAREAYVEALEVRRRDAAEGLATARSDYRLGALAFRQGQLDVAQKHFESSHRIRERFAPGSYDFSVSLTGLGVVAWEQGELRRATGFFERSLALNEELAPGSLGVAVNLTNLANLAWKLGKLENAETYYYRALEIQDRLAPEAPTTATSVNGLGLVAAARGQLERAEAFHRRALAIREQIAPGSRGTANSLNNLGTLMWRKGDFDSAMDYHRRALAIEEEIAPDSLSVALSLNNIGTVHARLGEFELAAEDYRHALALRERLAPDSLDVAATLNNLGELAFQQEDHELALSYFQRALEIEERQAPEGGSINSSLNNIGSVFFQLGKLEKAEGAFRRALAIQERISLESLVAARLFHNLGQVEAERGEYGRASRSYEKALAIRSRLAPGSWGEAHVLWSLGKLARQRQRLEEALVHHQKAIKSVEAQVERLGVPHDTQAGFRSKFEGIYRAGIELLVELQRLESAFDLLESSRARSFLAMLAERRLLFSADASPELLRRRQRLAWRYDYVQQELTELDPASDREQIEARLVELRRLRRSSADIADEIRRTSPRLAALQYPEPFDVDGARQGLDPGTILLSYSVGDEETHLFALSSESKLRAERLRIGEEKLRGKVTAFRKLIAQARPDTRHGARRLAGLGLSAHELYRALLAPFADQIERAERLLILPDGPLHQLPWSALVRPDGKYLVEWKPYHVALSATVYAELRRERAHERRTDGPLLTAFGDPEYPPRFANTGAKISDVRVRAAAERGFGFEPLPGTRREVERIAALYDEGAAFFLGAEATEERAKSAGRGARYLHFATHGLLDERFPLNSGLALTIPDELGEGLDNGLLQAWEIFESMRLDAELVVLSACESALGREVGGEGLIGLTRAFQYAGARSVLASLWQVADESTAVLMERFYHHLRAGKAKDEALQAAQLELLRGDAPAPYAWAAFQLHGDWR